MAMLSSNNLEQSLHRALAQASAAGHEYATLEHLLLALTEDPDAQAVLLACAVSVERLQTALRHALENDLGDLVRASLDVAKPTGWIPACDDQRAALHVQSSGRDDVTGGQCSCRSFFRTRQPRRLLLTATGHESSGCGQLYQPCLSKGDEQKEGPKMP